MAASNESKSQFGSVWSPAAFISSWPKSRSSSRRSLARVPPTTALPALRSRSASSPKPQSSKTTTSAQSACAFQSSTLSTKPSATSLSFRERMAYLTEWPSWRTCHARSWMRAHWETNRNLIAGSIIHHRP